MSKSPALNVVGFYSLSADKAAYGRFIQNEIASRDPANFSEDQKALFRRLGRGDSLHPFTDDDRRELDQHLRRHMDEAAVFEVMVSNPDASFDLGKFVQPNPSQSEEFWQVAWNEKFLTADGETLIKLDRTQKLPDAPQYRVAFVIHFWKPKLPLRSSYGNWLSLPNSLYQSGCGVWRPMRLRTKNALVNHRHMPRHMARRGAVEARIILHLDLPPESAEAGALVERQCGRMIEGAGVQLEAIDRPRPRKLQRVVHQPAAGTGADKFWGDAEHADLARTGLTEIQFEQPLVTAVCDQRMCFDQRMIQPGRELVVGSADAGEPQPFLADAPIEIAIPGKIGPLDVSQCPRTGWR